MITDREVRQMQKHIAALELIVEDLVRHNTTSSYIQKIKICDCNRRFKTELLNKSFKNSE
jgi:hypothetical protein